MARLSRLESQAQTRARLIAQAKISFLRDGYFATSLERVADEAGYSKGAVYSNFPSKDALSLAVLDEIRAEQSAALAAAVGGKGTLAARLDALERWAEATLGDEGWSVFEMELGSSARANATLRAEIAERNASARALVAAVLEAGAAELDVELPLPAEELAAALLSLGVGLGLQRAMDAAVSVRALTNTIRVLVGIAPKKTRRR